MVKYRMSFRKDAPVRYISHLDLSSLLHRAFRRAKLPVAYSEGFNPHPIMSLGSALRLGTTSGCEYLDVEFSEELDPREARQRLQQALPAGIEIGDFRRIPAEAPAAMAVINAAGYRLVCQKESGSICAGEILAGVMAEECIEVVRNTKSGSKTLNLRPLIHQVIVVSDNPDTVELDALLAAADYGTGRPEELLQVLIERGLCRSGENNSIHRTGLYRLYPDGEIRTPFQVLNKESLVKPVQPVE